MCVEPMALARMMRILLLLLLLLLGLSGLVWFGADGKDDDDGTINSSLCHREDRVKNLLGPLSASAHFRNANESRQDYQFQLDSSLSEKKKERKGSHSPQAYTRI